MSLSRVLLHLNTRHEPAARGSEAPEAPHAPEPTPVPGSEAFEPAHAHTAPPDMSSGPTDVPPLGSYLHWHADEARALAKLADLTAWCSDPRYAADLMWST